MEKQFTEAELNMMAKAYHDNHFNHVQHSYIDICGDLVAGTLLSRIVFWFAPNQQGKSKLRVFKDGHYWLAKNRTDWWDEIRITAKQYDRAIKILQQKNLIIKKIYKFDKDPTTHIRLNHEQLEIEVNKWIANIKQMIVDGEIDEKGRKTNSPKGKKPVKTRDTSDSSKNDESNNGAQTQYYQGEEPKPLGNLVFPQMGKTNSPKREKGNSPNGKKEIPQTGKSLTGKTYRENIQGISLTTTTKKTQKIWRWWKKKFNLHKITSSISSTQIFPKKKRSAFLKFARRKNKIPGSLLKKHISISTKNKRTSRI